jgi:K+-sensing histidine kinase KdpD
VTTISGNAELLRDRGRRLTPEQRDAMVADIAADADRLRIMVENMLLLSRLDAGYRPEAEPQLLGRLVDDEIAVFERGHPDLAIRSNAASEPRLVVDADPTFVVIVIHNLLSNGAKYGAPDGVVVTVSAHGDEAWVCVLDRGLGLAGIDPEDLFRPFYRAPAAQEVAGGAGLGLTAAQRAVAALGGRMWATARDGGGAEFGFSLPLAEAPVPAFEGGA